MPDMPVVQRKTKRDRAAVVKALRQSYGVYAEAARKLGVERRTVSRYVKRFGLEEVMRECTEDLIDLAEAKLEAQIRMGNMNAIRLLLMTRGKHRGYVYRTETTGKDGQAIEVAQPPQRPPRAETMAEFMEMAQHALPAPNGHVPDKED